MILEAIKDHLVLHVAEKTRSKDMSDALVSFFRNDNMSQKMILKTKFREWTMNPSNNVTNYLMRITQIYEHLAAIGEVVLDVDLVNVALNGFNKAWEPFIMAICAQEHLPIEKEFGVTASKRRLIQSPRPASKEEKQQMKTWLWSARRRRLKGKFPSRVIVRERDSNIGRREI